MGFDAHLLRAVLTQTQFAFSGDEESVSNNRVIVINDVDDCIIQKSANDSSAPSTQNWNSDLNPEENCSHFTLNEVQQSSAKTKLSRKTAVTIVLV